MKRQIILAITMLLSLVMLIGTTLYAQNSVTLVFTGQDQNNAYVRLNRVTIQNLSREWSETIYFPDTVYTLDFGTSIENIQHNEIMQVMPNPFYGHTRMNVSSPQHEEVKMVIVDINGKKCAEYSGLLISGDNYFDISLTTPQTYILTVISHSGMRSVKMVNMGHASSNHISNNGNTLKTAKINIKSTSTHEFELGDEMQYIGYAQIGNTMVQSVPIQQMQYTNEDITLSFQESVIEVTTDSVLFINDTTYICYGSVNTYGQGAVNAGFCWDTNPYPTLVNEHIASGMADDFFTNYLTGMSPYKTYYVRAYATNGTDTAYGETFRCLPSMFVCIDTVYIPDGRDCDNGCAFESSITISNYTPYDTIQSANDILFVRIKMEHSYIGDLYIAMTCPNGQTVKILNKYTTGGHSNCSSQIPTPWGWQVTTGVTTSADFGNAYAYTDEDVHACNTSYLINMMGTPWNYCWSNNTDRGYQYANGQGYVYENVNITNGKVNSTNTVNMSQVYHPDQSFSQLIGCPINGTWSISITDSWKSDNGWITEWELALDKSNTHGLAYTDSLALYPCQDITTVMDYDGNEYHTVAIGSQCWLKENMRTTHYADGTAINLGNGDFSSTACYYLPENAGIFTEAAGYLYNWEATMYDGNNTNINSNGSQGICPTGWHVPSDAEWTEMTDYIRCKEEYLCSENVNHIAKALASNSGWIPSTNFCAVGNEMIVNNSTEFTAIPVGHVDSSSVEFGVDARFWSSTPYNYTYAYFRELNYDHAYVERNNYGHKNMGMSVRCICDKTVMVTTYNINDITSTTATCGGHVTNTEGATGLVYGICWSTSPNPTTSDNHTIDGEGTGSFTSYLTGLSPNTTYYVRAYANGSTGVFYGMQQSFTTPVELPTISTDNVNSITCISAICGGNVTSSGGDTVTARGVCWSTSQNPTINESLTVDGNGLGTFTSLITGLEPNTAYYVRAYATNSAGTAYGSQQFFTTTDTIPVVTTASVSNVSFTSATCGGNVISEGITSVTARGVCWSTSQNPTINDSLTVDSSGLGSFTSSIIGLQPETTYYVRAYASNSISTSYGSQKTFTTHSTLPTVSTDVVWGIHFTGAICGGNVTFEGISSVTACGVCWSTSPNPTTNDSFTVNHSGLGSFTSYITGLQPNTQYYIRAYATNSVGTAYGTQRTFTTTIATPAITTNNVSDITCTTATCGGNVTSQGISSVTARGVCWSTSQNPTINDSLTIESGSSGSFTSNITGLEPGTTYYVRAYATNSAGTAYGTQRDFTTLAATPLVNTNTVNNITCTSAICGGNVTFEGISAVTFRGVCWSTSPNPTINDNHTFDGDGIGSFTSTITGLEPDTTYYVRAYASNNTGTGYGMQQTFTTPIATPLVTTTIVDSITFTTAHGGGNVTFEGISAVTARGVCWSTSSNPTINDSFTIDSNGLGNFSSFITNLQPQTYYHLRAYATNSAGTAYGNEVNFTTNMDGLPCFNAASVDDYDGNTYNTVQIGQQCWMKENLRTTHYANGTNIPLGSGSSTTTAYYYYPNNDSSLVSTYGYLYNWRAVMNNSNASSTNPSGVQGICPNGWHMPSDAEWSQLTNYVGSQSQYICDDDNTYVASALAHTIGWSSSANTCSVGLEQNSNNATGFSALPAGYHAFGGIHYFGSYTYFWSVTDCYYSDAYSRSLRHNYAYVNRNATSISGGLSVRCVKD